MKCGQLILITLALSIYCFQLSAIDELWKKAQQVTNTTGQWIPKTIITTSTVKDGNQKVTDVSKMWIKTQVVNNELKKDIVKIIENDKDITAETLAKQKNKEDKKDKEYSTSISNGIFKPENEKYLTLKRYDKNVVIGEFTCVPFAFTLKMKDEDGKKIVQEGTVWLDVNSGAPIQVQQKMNDLPIVARNFKMTVYYDYLNGVSRAKQLVVEGMVSLLVKKSYIHSVTEMKDYYYIKDKLKP